MSVLPYGMVFSKVGMQRENKDAVDFWYRRFCLLVG